MYYKKKKQFSVIQNGSVGATMYRMDKQERQTKPAGLSDLFYQVTGVSLTVPPARAPHPWWEDSLDELNNLKKN